MGERVGNKTALDETAQPVPIAGCLFYLMGASGSGKDSLLRGVREQLSPEDRCFVAHRYITRKPELAGENHIYLTPEEFQARQALEAFALDWDSNGHRYGIGIEVAAWMAKGISVIVNGSRAYLPQARQRFPSLVPLLVWVESERLRERLVGRGRESGAEIEARLRRAAALAAHLPEDCLRVDNGGSLQEGVTQLLGIVRDHRQNQASDMGSPRV